MQPMKSAATKVVMPGLVPGIHDFGKEDVDGRVKPDHDET
jgi:hypothetical protein